MTSATITPATARFIEYLRSIGGSDVHELVDEKGEPDPLAARRLAETLRARHAADLGVALSVAQSANRVTVSALDESPARPLRRR